MTEQLQADTNAAMLRQRLVLAEVLGNDAAQLEVTLKATQRQLAQVQAELDAAKAELAELKRSKE